jgi:hypothetical protein
MTTFAKAFYARLHLQKLFTRGSIPNLLGKWSHGQEKIGKWGMCTYFTDLNKCCLKDDFPLSRIDKMVDSAIDCETMTLLSCFSCYHQIWLRKKEEEKQALLHHSAPTIISECRDLCKYVWSPIKTQPREMCLQRTKRQSTRVPNIRKRD